MLRYMDGSVRLGGYSLGRRCGYSMVRCVDGTGMLRCGYGSVLFLWVFRHPRMRLLVGVSLENDHQVFLENDRRFWKACPRQCSG
jgi:hypothetical protein